MSKSRHAYVRIRRSRACTFQVWLSPGGVVYARIRFESKMVMFGNTVGLYKHVITNNQLISRAYYCVNFSTPYLLEGLRKYSICIVNNHLLQRDSFCGSPDWFHPIKYWKYEFMHWISTWAVSIIDFPLSLVRVWNKAHPSWKKYFHHRSWHSEGHDRISVFGGNLHTSFFYIRNRVLKERGSLKKKTLEPSFEKKYYRKYVLPSWLKKPLVSFQNGD